VRDRAANIVAKKPAVERQRRRKCLDLGNTAAIKSSPDEIVRGFGAFLLATPFHFFTVYRAGRCGVGSGKIN